MRKHIVTLVCFVFISFVFIFNAHAKKSMIAKIIDAVNSYGNAISCPYVDADIARIIGLVPYSDGEDLFLTKYAVLWEGDIGCAGGSGTTATHIAIVKASIADTFMVDPLQSSPVVKFESPVRFVESVIDYTADSLTLKGKEYGPEDSNCCPSINVSFTLRVDAKGNWNLVNKKYLPPDSEDMLNNDP